MHDSGFFNAEFTVKRSHMENNPRALCVALALVALTGCSDKAPPATQGAAKPALTVAAVTPQVLSWPQTLAASGNVTA